MSMRWPQAGAGNHASYGVSGIPYASGTTVSDLTTQKFKFDFVTRFFWVKNNSGNDLFVGFTENGVSGSNRFTVTASGESPVLEMRLRELFIRAETGDVSVEVIAGLTAIPRSNYFSLTGSQFISGAVFLESGVG